MAVPGQQEQTCSRRLIPEADHCEERPAKQFDPAEVGLSVGLRRLPTLASQEPILVFRQLVDVMRTSP